LAYEGTKVKNTKIIKTIEGNIHWYALLNNVAGFYMPLIFIFGFIFCLIWTIVMRAADKIPLMLLDGIQGGGLNSLFCMIIEVLVKPPTLGCILLLICTIYCRKIAQEAERKVSELGSRRRFS